MKIKMTSGLYKKTDKHKYNISKALKGKIILQKTRIKISKTLTGYKHSNETKYKMSKSSKGKNNPNYGNKYTGDRLKNTAYHGKMGRYKRWKINRSSGLKKKWYELIYYIKTKLMMW